MNPKHGPEAGPPRNFLPDLCAVRAIFVVVISAELLSIVLTLADSRGVTQFWTELSIRSIYVQWIALCWAAAICLLRRGLQYLSHTLAGMLAWLLAVLVAAAISMAAYWLMPEMLASSSDFVELLLKSILITSIVAAMALRYLFEGFQQKQRELAASRARYQALQARIRPHFLFNSMNTIASLTRIDPPLAERLVQDLADLFRATFAREGHLSTIAEEIDLGQRYLRIEQQRLGPRLQVVWEVDALPGDAAMPVLTLQPLLENAVYHGIEPSLQGGEIVIRGERFAGRLRITIFNTLSAAAGGRRKGAQMALDNVRQRLLSVFAERGKLQTRYADGGFLVLLDIPLQPS